MTVNELIDKLEGCLPNAEVVFKTREHGGPNYPNEQWLEVLEIHKVEEEDKGDTVVLSDGMNDGWANS